VVSRLAVNEPPITPLPHMPFCHLGLLNDEPIGCDDLSAEDAGRGKLENLLVLVAIVITGTCNSHLNGRRRAFVARWRESTGSMRECAVQ
jgi:hypothetical protein